MRRKLAVNFSKIISAFLTVLVVGLVASCSSDKSSIPPPCTTCPEENPVVAAAATYVNQHLADYDLRAGVDVMEPARVVDGADSSHNVGFNQYYHGVRVYHSYLTVNVGSDLEILSTLGAVVVGVDADTRYQIASSVAGATAANSFLGFFSDGALTKAAELAILRHDDADYLSWYFQFYSGSVQAYGDYFIDAKNGELIEYHISHVIY